MSGRNSSVVVTVVTVITVVIVIDVVTVVDVIERGRRVDHAVVIVVVTVVTVVTVVIAGSGRRGRRGHLTRGRGRCTDGDRLRQRVCGSGSLRRNTAASAIPHDDQRRHDGERTFHLVKSRARLIGPP
jgi:hypothetical protein